MTPYHSIAGYGTMSCLAGEGESRANTSREIQGAQVGALLEHCPWAPEVLEDLLGLAHPWPLHSIK
jgi:hypothetical protein